MVKYTTATIVRSLIDNAGSPLSDAEIEEFITQCEGWADVLLRIDNDTFTFDSTEPRHLALRNLVSLKAAIMVVASTPLSHQTLLQAGMTLNVLHDQYTDSLKFLTDTGAADFIKEV